MMIKHIVFDIGRVLIRWEPELPYLRLIPDDAHRAWFLANVCTGDWNKEQDRGRTWADAEDALIAQHPDEAHNIRAYRAHWHEMVPGLIEGTSEIFDALLAAGYDVTMLTNFSTETFPEAQERFPVLKKSRGVTVSGAIGLLKPDRAIYDHHVKRFDLDPAATLFFDDSADNVTGAQAAGWQACLFTDAGQMRRDLKAHGVALDGSSQ